MRVNRTKKRLNKWYRYIAHTHSIPRNKNLGYFHRGHIKAYAGVMYAQRYVPIGVREPYVLYAFDPPGSRYEPRKTILLGAGT